MKVGIETAAVCGLFCGTCPSYPEECGGCLSGRVAPMCANCDSGFRDCAKLHKITRCHECSEFPCSRLEDFSKKHIVNGVCHHAKIIGNLKSMKAIGLEAWIEEQTQENTCPVCGRLIPWYERRCSVCAKQ